MTSMRFVRNGKEFWIGKHADMWFIYEQVTYSVDTWFIYEQGTHSVEALRDVEDVKKALDGDSYNVIGLVSISYEEYKPFLDCVTFERYAVALSEDLATDGSYSTI